MNYLITVEEARETVAKYSRRLQPVSQNLIESAGLVLAKDLYSGISIPAYPQSGMDGYAMAFEPRRSYKLVGEMAAGSNKDFHLKPGEAVRIFTGAAVPEGADTVVMQEKTRVEDGILYIEGVNMEVGANVRPVGSEIEKGTLGLASGSLLTPAAIGFLAGIGETQVQVIPLPKVSIIVTGNELQTPGHPLEYGQVYEANSFSLLAALKNLDIYPIGIYKCGDDIGQLTEILLNALEESDVVLMTGGVSVGDYDFTSIAFEACGVLKIFHKIKQKPGKPILFGNRGEKLVFGLPGNPASVLTCFYQYVLPAFSVMSGKNLALPVRQIPLAAPFKKPAGLTHFLKGFYNGQTVELLEGQESYKLNSFAKANCLAEVPEEISVLEAGSMVNIHLFN